MTSLLVEIPPFGEYKIVRVSHGLKLSLADFFFSFSLSQPGGLALATDVSCSWLYSSFTLGRTCPSFPHSRPGWVKHTQRKVLLKAVSSSAVLKASCEVVGECKTISFCLLTKKWEKKTWCPSNSVPKSTFDSVPSRSVTPFSVLQNSLLVANPEQIHGRRLLACCCFLLLCTGFSLADSQIQL